MLDRAIALNHSSVEAHLILAAVLFRADPDRADWKDQLRAAKKLDPYGVYFDPYQKDNLQLGGVSTAIADAVKAAGAEYFGWPVAAIPCK